MYRIFLLMATLTIAGCADDLPPDLPAPAGGTAVDTARRSRPEAIRLAETGHRKADLPAKRTISFDLQWRDRPGSPARVTQRADGSAIHVRYASGTQAWWDSRHAWLLPAPGDTVRLEQARYDLRAWQYFLTLPYKLNDPGTHWQTLNDRTLDNRSCSVGRLRFDPGTGDSPDDWFVVFVDRDSALVRAAAYVETLGRRTTGQAAKTPRMIRYLDYRPVDGIPFAHRWAFRGWETDSLGEGEPIGEAVLSNLRLDVSDAVFRIPAGAERM